VEVVGWCGENSTIMPTVHTKAIKDKNFSKVYGDSFVYSYGNNSGECSMFVYRIAQMHEDGSIVDLPWYAVKARCKELGINHVPEVCDPFLYEWG
jgi:hypothetical protein